MFSQFQKLIFSILLLLMLFPASSYSKGEETKLRLALLPIPDVLPVYVAIENGYFADAGIEVEPLTVGSAIARDQLMQAGRIDGMINEISGAATFNREKSQVKIVAIARSPIGDAPLFRVLAAPKSGLKSVKDLAGVPIGVSKNTVIEYVTGRLLTAGWVSIDDVKYQSVPVLPERMQLLLSGQIQAATLPDPLGSAAIKAGAIEIVNDTVLATISASVVSFAVDALTEKKETVKKFMEAWDKAVVDLNSDPDSYRSLMLKKIRVPKNVQHDFRIPPMPRNTLPSQVQWDDVMSWMMEKQLLKEPLSYDSTVTNEFLAQ